MKKKEGSLSLAIVMVVCFTAMIAIGLYLAYNKSLLTQTFTKEQEKPIACTKEAKICPDGSAVSRTGPNCEFAKCPIDNCYIGGCSRQIVQIKQA